MRYFLSLLLLCPIFLQAQTTDNVGPGQSLYFTGSSGNVDFGDSFNDLAFPFSFSCWLKLDPSKNNIAAVFATEEGDFLYRGMWVRVTKTNLGIGWGDGTGGNYENYRRVKIADVSDISGKWIHFAAIAKADNNIDLYLNGNLLSSYWTGTSNLTMVNNIGDRVKLGEFYTNGETWRMLGEIDEVRLWRYARTKEEIRRDMCKKLQGDEADLVGYWNLNETSGNSTHDLSSPSEDGLRFGSIVPKYSGAPIGDESIYNYSGSYENMAIYHKEDTLRINSLSIYAPGVHLYKVLAPPSQYDNANSCTGDYYFGIFVAREGNQSFDVELNFSRKGSDWVIRKDNSESIWNNLTDPDGVINIENRSELLPPLKEVLFLDPVPPICLGTPVTIETDAISVLWEDGTTGRMRSFQHEGWFKATLFGNCNEKSDSVKITFKEEDTLDLGADMEICSNELVTFQGNGKEIIWQDGITGNTRSFFSPGPYIGEIEGNCSVVSDTIIVLPIATEPFVSNVMTVNHDGKNESFYVDPTLIGSTIKIINRWGKLVYVDNFYENDWSGGKLSAGVYFYQIENSCLTNPLKGAIHLMR